MSEERHGTELDQSGGSFYGWRRGWPLPDLVTRPGGEVSIETTPAVELLAHLAALPESEVARRLNEGHHIFLLRVDGEPAAYGWSATGPADIGGLALSFVVPRGERYLWDFVTLPAYRGRGLYPLLLQEIVLACQHAAAEEAAGKRRQDDRENRDGYEPGVAHHPS